jgi:endonuclease/exonuclease/phosphatase family metal-dependent hydrolase
LRLATWNCQPGLASNWDVIEELKVDVIAIQEARSDTRAIVKQHKDWMCLWREGKYYPGLAILARKPFRIEEETATYPFVLSCLVLGGAEPFRFANFWAMTPRNVGGLSYTQQARQVIKDLPDDLDTVMAGDFNHSKYLPHLQNVGRLGERGWLSAYHKFHKTQPADNEEEMTRYSRGPDDPSWHIDLVFVPDAWTISSVEVGTFGQYPGRGRSDHVPVVVTIGSTQAA